MSALQAVKCMGRKALYHSGVWGLYHRVRNRQALTVLMFHRVLPADDPAFALAEREFTFTLEGFRRALDFVQRHYHVVTLRQLAADREQGQPLPPNPVLITFDDGWRDTVVHALPELQRRSLSALLFVAWDAINQHPERWWQDALVSAMAQPGVRARLCERAGWPAQDADRADVHRRLSAWMAGLPHEARVAALRAGAPGVWEAVSKRQMINVDELDAWLKAGMEVGSHGMSHAPLTHCDKARGELQASLAHLKLNAPGMPANLSFPHGDLTPGLAHEASQAGYQWLFTSDAHLCEWPPKVAAAPLIGRIHLPENEWTCDSDRVNFSRLAGFLFARPLCPVSSA
ncbi:polysaccharide deacetylase family protein [Acidovorax sp.]|uniref:polysaccharide deacetylase family protein n=1 Tax=Acidovorax sp. TaxID=1872122 RepID=UPI002FB978CF